jgi:Mlc titration factor MtfA (ptsG expression regulator)
MFFNLLRNLRRRRWLAERQPSMWEDWLKANVWQYRHLDPKQQSKVQRFVCILFHEKHWDSGGGLTVTDEMRVTVAGQAALATLGFEEPYYFDRLQTIILYPGAFSGRPKSSENLLLGELSPIQDFSARTGESWQGGPIILSWNSVLREGQNSRLRRNVVLHEFAHHMDSLDGNTDGAPPFNDYEFEKKWFRVTQAEYQRLLKFAQRGQPTLLDHYGATNQAEFFAVATECFFTQPHALAAEHEKLHGVLVRLFGQDPRDWLPRLEERATG